MLHEFNIINKIVLLLLFTIHSVAVFDYILSCIQAKYDVIEIESAHTRFVCASFITDITRA